MTWYAGAEGTTPTPRDTEEEALAAAQAMKSAVAVVWEVHDEHGESQ